VAKWQQGGSSMEVVLELGEEKRRVGMGAMETGQGLGLL
jgi:hypothetical protein